MFVRDSAMSKFEDLFVTSLMPKRQKGTRAVLSFILKAMRLRSIWIEISGLQERGRCINLLDR